MLVDIHLYHLSNNLIKYDHSDNPRGAVCKDNNYNIMIHPDPSGPRYIIKTQKQPFQLLILGLLASVCHLAHYLIYCAFAICQDFVSVYIFYSKFENVDIVNIKFKLLAYVCLNYGCSA